MAGPIERAIDLVPQFARVRTFDWDQASEGMRQILWGCSRKSSSPTIWAILLTPFIATMLTWMASAGPGHCVFAFQIYCDFSGYSDIAIGSARLFGFELTRNFINPYFSRDIAEFCAAGISPSQPGFGIISTFRLAGIGVVGGAGYAIFC